MKTKEELKEIKNEVEELSKKLAELTEEELTQVVGGLEDFLPDEFEEAPSPGYSPNPPKFGRERHHNHHNVAV